MISRLRFAVNVPLIALAAVGGLALLRSEACAADVARLPELAPYQARYQVSRNGSTLGQSVVTLAREGAHWRLRSVTRGTDGLAALAGIEIVEDSHFRLRAGVPETIDYSFRQKTAWKNRERAVTVNVEVGTVLSTDKDRRHSFAYRAGAVDRQLVTLALSQDLARGKKELVYPVIDRDDFDDERYEAGALETTASPMGPLRTLRVSRVRENPGRTTTSWLAVDHGFVPARILQGEPDGDSFELRLVALER